RLNARGQQRLDLVFQLIARRALEPALRVGLQEAQQGAGGQQARLGLGGGGLVAGVQRALDLAGDAEKNRARLRGVEVIAQRGEEVPRRRALGRFEIDASVQG